MTCRILNKFWIRGVLIGLGFSYCFVASMPAQFAARTEQYADFNPGKDDREKGKGWVKVIEILSPALRSEVKGDVKVEFKAPGMAVARALCWSQPTEENPNPFGHDVVLAEIELDTEGKGSFVFPADKFPNGPVHVRIGVNNADKSERDSRELQLFNLGGVKWNQGIPKNVPPQAEGMKVVYSDDFDGPLSISKDGLKTRYHSHKPGGGDFSGWPFSDFESDLNPFSQTGTWLRIRGSKRSDGKSSSGLITPAKADFTGDFVQVPFYMECRFIAQSAPGTWPAFWSLTHGGEGSDELDIIEAYGGFGKGNPNYTGYSTTSHFWGQKDAEGKKKKGIGKQHEMLQLGGKSSWSHTFHTYGLKVTETDTIYYLNNIEIQRHPTNEVSRTQKHYFLINYAIGGISGWPIDLKREGDATDMFVDFVRVYSGKPAVVVKSSASLQTRAIGLNVAVPGDEKTEMDPELVAGEAGFSQAHWNHLSGIHGVNKPLEDHAGNMLPDTSVNWSVTDADPRNLRAAREWGFNTGNLRMLRGVAAGGKLSVAGIPYKKYNVHLYFNAGDHGGVGKVSISSPEGGVDPKGVRFYSVGWQGGKFVRSEATVPEAVKGSNTVVFSGNTAKSFSLDWESGLKGAWTGLSGIQIVEVP